jgi:uncharacterized protein YciI
MTEAEDEAWGRHWERLKRLYLDGVVVFAGPTLGRQNDGLCIIEAPDEAAARAIMEADPTVAEGFATGELRPLRISLLRGRDEERIRREFESPSHDGR